MANGRPDFNGVWDHPYVPDMTLSAKSAVQQKGAGPLPFTPAGLENIKRYDPEKDGDYTGMCMPYGLTRSFNGPFPIQIMQTDRHVAFLFEMGTWFHVVPFTDAHSAQPNPTWFGESIAKWDGDTLVVDTIGFNGWSRLDTRGHPHSDKLHVVQTFRRYDAGHVDLPDTEAELTESAVPYEVGISRYRELARGAIVGDSYGMLKLLVSNSPRLSSK